MSQFHNFGLKASRLLRQDGYPVRAMASGDVSQSVAAASPENVLEWVKQDKRRMLHVVYRVGDLDRTIKYALYYIPIGSCLWIKLFNKRLYNYGREGKIKMNQVSFLS